ncbi:MAG: aerotolerance regulator BatA [Elusimicrobia bacterium]|nr:MAG: aerotolerance regulator BatA [Elusimicrobiota bacterium]
MRFEEPLWLIAAIPVLIVFTIVLGGWHQRRAALSFPGAGNLRAVPEWQSWLVRGTSPLLTTLALLLMVIALARPQKIKREAAGATEGIDILLAIDTSLSMQAIDFDPMNRMTAARTAAIEFVGKRLTDRIGALVFGGDPLLMSPLTLDYDGLRSFLEVIYAGMTHSEGTAIGDGLAAAVNHLKDSESETKIVILLTDGRSNTGVIDPLTAAKTAKAFGIKVYTIGTAKRGQSYVPQDTAFGRRLVPIRDDLDEDTLLQIAAETDGKYFRATNIEELKEIYAIIDRLEKTEFDRPELITYSDILFPFLLPAALLLIIEFISSRTLLRRLP